MRYFKSTLLTLEKSHCAVQIFSIVLSFPNTTITIVIKTKYAFYVEYIQFPKNISNP